MVSELDRLILLLPEHTQLIDVVFCVLHLTQTPDKLLRLVDKLLTIYGVSCDEAQPEGCDEP